MNKQISIQVIIILVVVLAIGGYFLWQQTSNLEDAKTEITDLELNVATLTGNVATLETELADSATEISSLETELTASRESIASLQSQVASEQTKYADLQSGLDMLWTSLDKKLAVWETIVDFWVYDLHRYSADEISESEMDSQEEVFMTDMPVKVDDIGNDELNMLWNDYYNEFNNENYEALNSIMAEMVYLLDGLIKQDIEAIETILQ